MFENIVFHVDVNSAFLSWEAVFRLERMGAVSYTHLDVYKRQAIRKLAEKPCIILGRCASEILKDQRNAFNIYVCADKEDRIKRIMNLENLSYDEAEEKVTRTDEKRADYYFEHTGKAWGDVNNYHMILDTSRLGVENLSLIHI